MRSNDASTLCNLMYPISALSFNHPLDPLNPKPPTNWVRLLVHRVRLKTKPAQKYTSIQQGMKL